MRVLLAEDDPMIGASVRRGLAQDGFAVDWVEDGRAAQVALAERVHDALVLDLGLPRQAGLEVLTAMRRAGDTRPVLITTARDAMRLAAQKLPIKTKFVTRADQEGGAI